MSLPEKNWIFQLDSFYFTRYVFFRGRGLFFVWQCWVVFWYCSVWHMSCECLLLIFGMLIVLKNFKIPILIVTLIVTFGNVGWFVFDIEVYVVGFFAVRFIQKFAVRLPILQDTRLPRTCYLFIGQNLTPKKRLSCSLFFGSQKKGGLFMFYYSTLKKYAQYAYYVRSKPNGTFWTLLSHTLQCTSDKILQKILKKIVHPTKLKSFTKIK